MDFDDTSSPPTYFRKEGPNFEENIKQKQKQSKIFGLPQEPSWTLICFLPAAKWEDGIPRREKQLGV